MYIVECNVKRVGQFSEGGAGHVLSPYAGDTELVLQIVSNIKSSQSMKKVLYILSFTTSMHATLHFQWSLLSSSSCQLSHNLLKQRTTNMCTLMHGVQSHSSGRGHPY